MPEIPQEGSPEWWLWKGETRLNDRNRVEQLELYDSYYEGEHRLAFASLSYTSHFGEMLKDFADDWCQVCVDALAERMNPIGFRFTSTAADGDVAAADDDANRMWQSNQLDANFRLAITDTITLSETAAIVWRGPDDRAQITFEHPSEVVVFHKPGSLTERLAAVKIWTEDDGTRFAYVYLPDGIYKYRTRRTIDSALVLPAGVSLARWVEYHPDGEDWPLDNPTGIVSVVPLYNEPRLRSGWRTSERSWSRGRSGIRKVIPLQDALNALVRNMLTASEYSAIRQRWATGIEPPIDPDTKQPIPAWELAADSVWIGNPKLNRQGNVPEKAFEPKFGTFDVTDLRNFVVGVEMIAQHIATVRRLPPHYLNASADRLSGESIKAAETGLVAMVGGEAVIIGEDLEEIIRLGFLMEDANDPRGRDMSAETIWRDFETRTESEHIDAVVKKRQGLDVPRRQTWEDAGYTPKQIERMEKWRAEELAEQAAADFSLGRLLNSGAGGPGAGG